MGAIRRIRPVVAVAGVALFAGCTFSPGQSAAPRVSPAEFAQGVEDAYYEETGVDTRIDCGDEPIPLEVDREVSCLLLTGGLEYDMVVTITDVGRDDYFVEWAVASVPNNAAPPTAEPSGPGDPVLPGADLATYVTSALAPQLGFVPTLQCDDLVVAVGSETMCAFDDAQGRHRVRVTVTAFDGSNFDYIADVLD